MQINMQKREITLKVVYYGPPLSGKTTNLQALHKLLDPSARGQLTQLDTSDDRTLFFDLLPVFGTTKSGYLLKLKLLTVPGQVVHVTTRRIVLQGCDGVVFVADSQLEHAKANNDFWFGMHHYLKQNDIDPATLPCVIQFNKRDLPNVRSDEEIDQIAKAGKEPVFKAIALKGDGVLETLEGVLKVLYTKLQKDHEFGTKFDVSESEFLSMLLGGAKGKAG